MIIPYIMEKWDGYSQLNGKIIQMFINVPNHQPVLGRQFCIPVLIGGYQLRSFKVLSDVISLVNRPTDLFTLSIP